MTSMVMPLIEVDSVLPADPDAPSTRPASLHRAPGGAGSVTASGVRRPAGRRGEGSGPITGGYGTRM